jgi:hypothetical protein
LEFVNRNRNSLSREMDEIEKKLLDIFNYYKREYKPFKIEKVHKDHGIEICSRTLYNNEIIHKIKRKIFRISKTRKDDLSCTEFSDGQVNVSAGLFEYIHKVNLSNQMIMSSSYNYETSNDFVQQLITPVICLTSNEIDFKNYYIYFQEYFKLLHEELREKIDFWKEYFSFASLRKKERNEDDGIKRTFLNQYEFV